MWHEQHQCWEYDIYVQIICCLRSICWKIGNIYVVLSAYILLHICYKDCIYGVTQTAYMSHYKHQCQSYKTYMLDIMCWFQVHTFSNFSTYIPFTQHICRHKYVVLKVYMLLTQHICYSKKDIFDAKIYIYVILKYVVFTYKYVVLIYVDLYSIYDAWTPHICRIKNIYAV